MSHPFYAGNFARRRGSRTCTLPPSRRTCRARRGTSSTWATTRSHWRPRSHENNVINEGNYCINIKFAVVFVKNNTRWADITKKESTFAQPWSLSWLIYEESELTGKACFLPSLRHVTQVLKMSGHALDLAISDTRLTNLEVHACTFLLESEWYCSAVKNKPREEKDEITHRRLPLPHCPDVGGQGWGEEEAQQVGWNAKRTT